MNRVFKPSILERMNQLPCLNCWSRDPPITTKHDYLDYYGPLLEYELECSNCGAFINHWAYGHMEFPETWTDLLQYNWNHLTKLVIPRALISHWGFTHRSPEYQFCQRYDEGERKPRFRYIEATTPSVEI